VVPIKSGRGTQPNDAAATDPPGTVRTLRDGGSVDQRRLRRCTRCGELKGQAVINDRDEGIIRLPVICICKGIPCPQCDKQLIPRPTSNKYDEATGTVWHTPWFGYLIRCTTRVASADAIRPTGPSARSEPRPRRQCGHENE